MELEKGTHVKVATKRDGTPSGAEMSNLLALIANERDIDAFRGIFSHFAPRIKAFVMRGAMDTQMAEDIVQETMTSVWLKAGQFDPNKAAASTWIFTIARNAKIDLLRKTKRPEPINEDLNLVPDAAPQADEIVDLQENAKRLQKYLEALPEEQKQVVRLAFYEEKTHSEIAEVLKLPLGTVKSRIRLAINRMRSELGEIQ